MSDNLELQNFKKYAIVTSFAAKQCLSGAELACLVYLADQEYNYLKNGEKKTGDTCSYTFIATKLGYSKRTIIECVKTLILLGMIVKQPKSNKWGNNKFSVNEDYFGIKNG